MERKVILKWESSLPDFSALCFERALSILTTGPLSQLGGKAIGRAKGTVKGKHRRGPRPQHRSPPSRERAAEAAEGSVSWEHLWTREWAGAWEDPLKYKSRHPLQPSSFTSWILFWRSTYKCAPRRMDKDLCCSPACESKHLETT